MHLTGPPADRRPDTGGGREAGPELSRDLGFFAVFSTATGTMVGAGIFILPGVAAEGAGPGAALSFLFAGLITALAALSVCELATAMPKAGGPYYFVSRAMGPLLGTIVGLGAWLALMFKGAFALVGFGQYVLHFSPVPVLLTAVAAGVLLVVVNLVGARASGLLQNLIVIALLAILGVFTVRGLFAVEPAVLRPLLPFGWGGVFSTTGVVFISYLGIVKAAAVAEEVRDPGRNLPLGILVSVVFVTVLYVCTMLIVTGVLPMAEITIATAPLADAGQVFLGAAGGVMVAVSGLLATASTGNAAILSSSRYPFAMARDALMTPWISQISARFRTPVRSIVVSGGIMILLVLALDVEGLAKLGGVLGMIVFSLVNLSVVVLRWTAPEWYRPSFRVPLYPLLPMVGAVAALAPIPQLGTLSHLAGLGLVGIGVVWYYGSVRQAGRAGKSIRPDYGLMDKLQQIRQVQAIQEKRRAREESTVGRGEPITVVAELVAGLPNKHLLVLASALARRFEAPVDVVVVTEVPPQSPLEGPVPPPPRRWVRRIHERMREYGVPLRFHHVLARDRARAILSFARPGARAILLDWHQEFHPIRLRGSYVDQILQRSPVRVGVLKYRGHKRYDRILVATAGGPYATAEVEMADALAAMTGADLTLLMVLPTDASPGREEQAREYLGQLDELTESKTPLVLRRGDDVAEAILAEAEDSDLIVLGATRRPRLGRFLGRHLVGPIADEIGERADGSVLVTRDPGAQRRMSTGVGRWLRDLRRRIQGRPPAGPGTRPESDVEVKVLTFPR